MQNGTQRRFRLSMLGIGLAIVLWTASTFAGFAALSRVQSQTTQRKRDLVTACLRTSARVAADVNLNWTYYQSEVTLAKPAPLPLKNLPPPARKFILGLLQAASKHNPTRTDLLIRANADYQAAEAKAKTVDYHQAALVHVRNGFGYDATPRSWVYQAHFSCAKAF